MEWADYYLLAFFYYANRGRELSFLNWKKLKPMKYAFTICLSLAIFFLACQSNQEGDSLVSMEEVPTLEGKVPQARTESTVNDLDGSKGESEAIKKLMLIKKGNLKFECKDIQATYSQIKGLVKDFDGYISRENQEQAYLRVSYFMEIRIPSKNFDAFVLSVDAGVGTYDQRSIEVDDVSEEFFDLQLRLENKKALAKRYRQLLPQTNKMNEIIELERELQKVSGEIDRIEGRMRFLKDQTSFSTVKINFYKPLDKPKQKVNSPSFGSRFVKNVKDGWSLVVEFFLGLVHIWPFILILGLVGGLIWRRRMLSKNK